MQINLSVQSLCSHTPHDDLLGRVMYDTDITKADLAHFSSGNLFILQPYAVGAEQEIGAVQYCTNHITQSFGFFKSTHGRQNETNVLQ